MQRDKKCSECGRYYRGEGYAGLCTELCFESTRTTGLERERILREIHGNDRPTTREYHKKITKANQKWLKKVEYSSAKSKYRLIEKALRKEMSKDGDGRRCSKKCNGLIG
jgi:hypothetical protein